MNAARFASPVRSSRSACRVSSRVASRSCTLASSLCSCSCSSLTTTRAPRGAATSSRRSRSAPRNRAGASTRSPDSDEHDHDRTSIGTWTRSSRGGAPRLRRRRSPTSADEQQVHRAQLDVLRAGSANTASDAHARRDEHRADQAERDSCRRPRRGAASGGSGRRSTSSRCRRPTRRRRRRSAGTSGPTAEDQREQGRRRDAQQRAPPERADDLIEARRRAAGSAGYGSRVGIGRRSPPLDGRLRRAIETVRPPGSRLSAVSDRPGARPGPTGRTSRSPGARGATRHRPPHGTVIPPAGPAPAAAAATARPRDPRRRPVAPS